MDSFSQYEFKDHFPELALYEIELVSKRAYSLLNRNNNGLRDKKGATHIIGALDSMDGLDYHFGRLVTLEKQDNETDEIHELTAYLNRLGQFFYFIKSKFSRSLISDPLTLTPKTCELIEFRKKVTAHRSNDYPRNEPESLRKRQSITFMTFAPYIRIEGNKKQYWLPVNESSNPESNFLYFEPHKDHHIIMNETYELLRKII